MAGAVVVLGVRRVPVAPAAAELPRSAVVGDKGAVPLPVEIIENDPMNMSAARLRWLYLRGPPQPWSLAARWDPGETILVLYYARNSRRNEADVFEARSDDLAKLQEQEGDQ
jgi:hypothetical protein